MARVNPGSRRQSGGQPQAPRQTNSKRFHEDQRHEIKQPKPNAAPQRGHRRGGLGGFSAQDARLKRRAKSRRHLAKKRSLA